MVYHSLPVLAKIIFIQLFCADLRQHLENMKEVRFPKLIVACDQLGRVKLLAMWLVKGLRCVA